MVRSYRQLQDIGGDLGAAIAAFKPQRPNSMNKGGEMKGDTHQTRRLHLITNPEHPDLAQVVTDASAPELAPVIPTPMAISYWQHPSQADPPAAS
jgi:hypothetical protein